MIKLYSTPTCAYCHMARDYLKQHKVTFKEVDISENPTAAAWVQQQTGQLAVPVTEIDGSFVVGFDRETIAHLLKKAKDLKTTKKADK